MYISPIGYQLSYINEELLLVAKNIILKGHKLSKILGGKFFSTAFIMCKLLLIVNC